jgi:hypothetical protein
VIIVATDDDDLLFERRVAALEQPQDIAMAVAEGLEIPAVLPGPLEAAIGEVLPQEITGSLATASAALTSLKLIAGQPLDVLVEFLGTDGIQRFQQYGVFLRPYRR